MKFFDPNTPKLSNTHARLYAIYEVAFTTVDFLAALLFVIGSVLFFDAATAYAGTWLFLIGSVFFGLKPTIRLVREWHLLRLGDFPELARNSRD